MVRDEQVRLLRSKMSEGKTQETAAGRAGMSVRTARKWQKGALPSAARQERAWRTRADPFKGAWEADVLPLLVRDEGAVLEAVTVMAELQERHPGRFLEGQVRTLQRRMRDWRADHGSPREVIFPQQHVAGREASIDFTCMNALAITIAGQFFPHLLFEFVLSFSGWTWVALAFSETYEALVAGVQGALWELRGVPSVIRSDNLSAATHELREGGRALTKRFRAVLDHYGTTSTRINPGVSHENGVVEQAHRRGKSAIAQALVLRGSRDFECVDDYMVFVKQVIDRARNRGIDAALAEDRKRLGPLPPAAVPCYTVFADVRVSCWSTVRVGGKMYSVPSRLIGHDVEVRQHADVVEVLRGNGKVIETMPRLRGERHVRIDYRHVIWSLVRKPGAFARYRYREELFPSLVFRQAYDALVGFTDRADVEYVRILHLAASTYETTVEQALSLLLASTERFDYAAVKALAQPEHPTVPDLVQPVADLTDYDRLLVGGAS
jgi:hypothetical protein